MPRSIQHLRQRCPHCGRGFNNPHRFAEHLSACASIQTPRLNKTFKGRFKLRRSAFKNFLVEYRLQPQFCQDITYLFGMEGQILSQLLRYLYHSMGCIKVQMCLMMHFVKDLPNNYSTEKFYACTQMKALLDVKDISNFLIEWEKELDSKIDQFVQRGSGWQLRRFDRMDIRVGKYVPRVGGCQTEIPAWIWKKRAVLSLKTHNDCFMYSVLAALHPCSKNRDRPTQYVQYIEKYDFSDVRGIVSIKDIEKFERKNEISINVYTLNFNAQTKMIRNPNFEDNDENIFDSNRTIVPLKVNKQEKDVHIDLLLIEEHYLLITNFNRLLGIQGDPQNKFCENCLTGF